MVIDLTNNGIMVIIWYNMVTHSNLQILLYLTIADSSVSHSFPVSPRFFVSILWKLPFEKILDKPQFHGSWVYPVWCATCCGAPFFCCPYSDTTCAWTLIYLDMIDMYSAPVRSHFCMEGTLDFDSCFQADRYSLLAKIHGCNHLKDPHELLR
jgi:hypothetical protein